MAENRPAEQQTKLKSATPAPNAAGNVASVDVETAEGTFADLHDRVIGHLYGSALTLNGIVNQHEVDGAIAQRLRAVIDDLDSAVQDIRTTSFVARLGGQFAENLPTPNTESGFGTRYLVRIEDDEVFAYAQGGHDFYRVKDRCLWAHESQDLLMSARSGARIAYRTGRIFYDATTDLPLYYEREQLPPSSRFARCGSAFVAERHTIAQPTEDEA